MSERIRAPHVGAPDPERRTPPIGEERDEAYEERAQPMDDLPTCRFGDSRFAADRRVCSGNELLCRRSGSWVPQDSCAPTNS